MVSKLSDPSVLVGQLCKMSGLENGFFEIFKKYMVTSTQIVIYFARHNFSQMTLLAELSNYRTHKWSFSTSPEI